MKLSQVSPWLDVENELLDEVIGAKWLTEGKYAGLFLEKFKDITETSYAVLAPNGTLGLYLALLSLNLPQGSEVIVPSFTFFGSASSIVFAGLKPVVVDVDLDDFSISIEKLEKALTKNTSAVMAVHMYGQAAKLNRITSFCRDNKLRLIEDAAQAMGVTYQDRHVGTFGDVAMISFFADKTITMGEGSVVMTQDLEVFERLKLIRNQGRPNSGTFVHPSLGMNFRITDMQAAVGYSQLFKLNDIIEQRKTTYKKYFEMLNGGEEVKFMKIDEDSTHIPFRVAITVRNKEKTIKNLEEKGFQTRSFFYPMHKQPGLMNYIDQIDGCENSLKLYETGICLPVHRDVKLENIEEICEIVRKSNEL